MTEKRFVPCPICHTCGWAGGKNSCACGYTGYPLSKGSGRRFLNPSHSSIAEPEKRNSPYWIPLWSFETWLQGADEADALNDDRPGGYFLGNWTFLLWHRLVHQATSNVPPRYRNGPLLRAPSTKLGTDPKKEASDTWKDHPHRPGYHHASCELCNPIRSASPQIPPAHTAGLWPPPSPRNPSPYPPLPWTQKRLAKILADLMAETRATISQ